MPEGGEIADGTLFYPVILGYLECLVTYYDTDVMTNKNITVDAVN